MKNQFTFEMFRTMTAEQVHKMAAERNFDNDFMTLWIEFTARMAKGAFRQLRKALSASNRLAVGLAILKGIGKLLGRSDRTGGSITPMGVHTVYPLSYDLNASQLNRKDLRFVIAYTNWKCHLLDWKFQAVIRRMADRIDDEIGMEQVLHNAQQIVACRK